jgi:hypothetical protein
MTSVAMSEHRGMASGVFGSAGRAPRLAVVSMAQFLIALDYSIMYVALPSITRDLRFAAGRFEGLGR